VGGSAALWLHRPVGGKTSLRNTGPHKCKILGVTKAGLRGGRGSEGVVSLHTGCGKNRKCAEQRFFRAQQERQRKGTKSGSGESTVTDLIDHGGSRKKGREESDAPSAGESGPPSSLTGDKHQTCTEDIILLQCALSAHIHA